MKRDALYHDEAIRQANEQHESRRHFDSLAMQTLGFSAVAFSLLLANKIQFTTKQQCIFIFCLISFLGVAISTITALWLRNWEFSPPLSDLYKNMESGEYDDEALTLWVDKSLSDTIPHNNKYLRIKAHALRVAYICLALEVVAIGILVFTLFS